MSDEDWKVWLHVCIIMTKLRYSPIISIENNLEVLFIMLYCYLQFCLSCWVMFIHTDELKICQVVCHTLYYPEIWLLLRSSCFDVVIVAVNYFIGSLQSRFPIQIISVSFRICKTDYYVISFSCRVKVKSVMAQALRKLVGKVLTCTNTSHHKTLSRLHSIQRFNAKHIISQNFSTTPQKLNNGWVDLTRWFVQKVSWFLSFLIYIYLLFW